MPNHLRLDLDLVELLAGVDTNDASNHLGDDNHVSEVSLDEVRLLVGLGLLLGLSQLLDQAHGLALQTTVDSATGTCVNDIAQLLRAEVQESVRAIVSASRFLSFMLVLGSFSIQLSIHRSNAKGKCGVVIGKLKNKAENILVEIDSSVGKLAEGSSLLDLSCLLRVLFTNSRSVLLCFSDMCVRADGQEMMGKTPLRTYSSAMIAVGVGRDFHFSMVMNRRAINLAMMGPSLINQSLGLWRAWLLLPPRQKILGFGNPLC